MKLSLIISCLWLLISSNTALAQDTLKAASNPHKAEAMAERMEQELNLSTTQKSQVMNMLVTRLEKHKERNNPLDAANNNGREKLTSILTKE